MGDWLDPECPLGGWGTIRCVRHAGAWGRSEQQRDQQVAATVSPTRRPPGTQSTLAICRMA